MDKLSEAIKSTFNELSNMTKEEFREELNKHMDNPRTLMLIELFKFGEYYETEKKEL